MKKNGIIIIILLLIISVAIAFLLRKDEISELIEPDKPIEISNNTEFDYKIIKETNKLHNKQNYMISPMSIAYALSMVNDGANENTKKQISELIGDYKIENDINIKNKIGIANLLFISNKHKNDINNTFINTLQTKYNSDVLFDEFKTPDLINKWVAEKTFNMIKNPISAINPDFVLGLANAIAIDVEWKNKFECNITNEEEFIKEDKSKLKVAMMHGSNDIDYIESKNAKGIIKDYKIYNKKTGEEEYEENDNTISLEYIAILPNEGIDEYLKNFNKLELNTLLKSKQSSSEKLDINLSLPKYTYDFSYNDFKDSLKELGMTDAFDSSKANFKNMLNENSDLNIYIDNAIHKSHIELSENGTKAAAVTVFTFANASLEPEKKEINIVFNKPFIYLIKEKNSDNIWFFGTVYEPMKWAENDTSLCNMQ